MSFPIEITQFYSGTLLETVSHVSNDETYIAIQHCRIGLSVKVFGYSYMIKQISSEVFQKGLEL